jgi:hypothetical protein
MASYASYLDLENRTRKKYQTRFLMHAEYSDFLNDQSSEPEL